MESISDRLFLLGLLTLGCGPDSSEHEDVSPDVAVCEAYQSAMEACYASYAGPALIEGLPSCLGHLYDVLYFIGADCLDEAEAAFVCLSNLPCGEFGGPTEPFDRVEPYLSLDLAIVCPDEVAAAQACIE